MTVIPNAPSRKAEERKRHRARVKADPERKQRFDEYNRSYARLRHRSAKQKAVEYLGGACADCKGVFHQSVFDFHHRDPTKKDVTPSTALLRNWDTAKLELDKCVLLCANCHRLRHHAQEQSVN